MRPHILLVTCHDLGRHLGCYGVTTVSSPNLDALAAEGVRFERAFATASGCSPSRAAIATGRYPHSNGVMGLAHPPFGWDLSPGERHMAEILRSSGYETHLFGHQHVTPSPSPPGFDQAHDFDGVLPPHERSWGRNASSRLGAFLKEAQTERPLYLEINLQEPHRPYDQGGAVPDDERGVLIPRYLPQDLASRSEMAAVQGAIRQADRAIGRILIALQEARLQDRTLVIFTADHGLAMPRAKCTLYDPGIEVTLILRWPEGGLTGGHVCLEMVSNVDVLPTVLEAAGVAVPQNVQGRSFLPLLRGQPYAARVGVYAEKTYHSYYDPMRAIRTDGFKYIRNFETAFLVEVPGDVQLSPIFREHVELYHGTQHPPIELYDLGADPLEQHNLAGDERFAGIQGSLDSQLWSWMAQTDDPLLRGPVPSPAYRRSLLLASNTLG